MENDKMNGLLKAYLSGQRHLPEKGADCPPAEILCKYASGTLKADELYGVSSHVKSCAFCNDLIEGALLYSAYGEHIKLEGVSERIKNKARSIHPAYKAKERKMANHFKRNIWFILSLASLAASFFFPGYFQQFLILAVIFGLKWVFNRESTRTLIMIYNAWKKHDKSSDKELEDIFKSRF